MVVSGFAPVPNTPGLGVELNEVVIREHLRAGSGYFAPTPEWDKQPGNDRLWS
jgi:hypothetical protein